MQSRLPRKCQRNQPESSWGSRGHAACLVLTAATSDALYHVIGWLHHPHPTLPPGLFSTSLRLKCFHAFLSFFLHVYQMRWEVFTMVPQGKYGVALKSRGNSESTCVWHFKKLVKSDRMYAQICFGNYLFKLFNYFMSKHPYQYFVLCIFNLNCKLTLQSLVLRSVSD